MPCISYLFILAERECDATGEIEGKLNRVDWEFMWKYQPHDRQGAVYRIKCTDCQVTYIGETGRNLKTRLTEHKRMDGNIRNHISEHHRLTKHKQEEY